MREDVPEGVLEKLGTITVRVRSVNQVTATEALITLTDIDWIIPSLCTRF